MSESIDLNADLGEYQPGDAMAASDAALLEVVSSANVACGFHAGGVEVMRTTCRLAAERGVVVGAHVSYLDREGFGRRAMALGDRLADGMVCDEAELFGWVAEQLDLISAVCQQTGARLGYVKPHGALYNTIVTDQAQAEVVVQAIAAVAPGLRLLGLPGSEVQRLAAASEVDFFVEAFADRGYLADGTLVPRDQPGALLHDPDLVAERMLRLVTEQVIEAVDGTLVPVVADSICVHGDSPGAVAMAQAVSERLRGAGVSIVSFVE